MQPAGYVGTTKNLQILLNTPQKSLLKSNHPKNTCQIFPPKKIPESKISMPNKFIDHPHHLKSGKPPLGLHSIASGLDKKKPSYIHFNG